MIENTLEVTSETEKKIVAPKTNIMPEVPSPSKKSVLSKALAYAYSFYKDKDTLTTLSEPPQILIQLLQHQLLLQHYYSRFGLILIHQIVKQMNQKIHITLILG